MSLIEKEYALKKAENQYYLNVINEQTKNEIIKFIKSLPPAQPDGISLEWIDKHLEWLDNCDNDFAQLAKVGIKAMVEIWKKDKI